MTERHPRGFGACFAEGAFQALLPLVPLLYLTRVLTPAELGYLGLTLAGATAIQHALALRAETSVGGDDGPDSPRAARDRAITLALALVGLGVTSLVCAALAFALPRFAAVFALAPALAAVRFVGVLELAGVADEARIHRHTLIAVFGNVAGLVLTIGLISGFELGWPGRILALVLAEGGMVAVRAAVLATKGQAHRLSWDGPRARRLIAESAPVLAASMLGLALDHANRLVALATLSMAEVGYFVVAYRVGMAVVTINRSLAHALAPRVGSRLEAGTLAPLVRLHMAYGGAILALGAVLALVALDATDVCFGGRFAPAAPFVAIVALGYGFQGVQRVAGIMLTRFGLPAPNPRYVVVALALNIVGGVLLVPRLGTLGPAWSTTLGLATLAVLSVVGAYRERSRRAGGQ